MRISPSWTARIGILAATPEGFISIKKIKLEKGTAPTIEYDPPAGYLAANTLFSAE